MSRLEALPADQKSVLQLLLRQGKGYDDLSEPAAPRRRRGALARLRRARHARPRRGRPARRAPPRDRRLAAGPAGARRGRGHPRLRRRLDGRARVGARRRPRARAARRRPAARAARRGRRDRDAERRADARPTTPAATPFAPAPTAAPARLAPRRRAAHRRRARRHRHRRRARHRPQRRRRQQEGRQHGDPGRQHDLDPAQPQVRAQINLTPPKGAPVKKAVAIVQIVDVNGQQAINAATQGLPTSSKKAAYGAVVLQQPVAGQARRRLRQDRQQGPPRPARAQLPKDVDIAELQGVLVITRETERQPDRAGHDLPARADPERRRRLGRRAAACRGS